MKNTNSNFISIGQWNSEGLCDQVRHSQAGGLQEYDAMR